MPLPKTSGFPSIAAAFKRGALFGMVLTTAILLFSPVVKICAGTNEINSIQQLNSLSPAELAQGKQVHLSGVVLCYDSGWNQLYIYDGQQTAYFNPHDFKIEAQRGQRVEISGTTTGQTGLTNATLKILTGGGNPLARSLELSQLAADWCQWIETTGWVLSAETSSGRYALLIQDHGQNCLAYVLGGETVTNDLKQLAGSKVRIRGINASKSRNGRLESASVLCPRRG